MLVLPGNGRRGAFPHTAPPQTYTFPTALFFSCVYPGIYRDHYLPHLHHHPSPASARLDAPPRRPCHPDPSPNPSESLRKPSPPTLTPALTSLPSFHYFNVRVTYKLPADGQAARGARKRNLPPPPAATAQTRPRGSSTRIPQHRAHQPNP